MKMDKNAIIKEIDSIKTAGAKLDKRIQACGVQVLEHFKEHKDTGLVNRLYLALSAGARKSAMASWLLAYGALSVNTDAKTRKEQPFVYDKAKVTDTVAAALDQWFNHKPEPDVADTFDLQKAVKALLAKAGAAKNLAHGDGDTLLALAGAVGIPASDVTTKFKKADAAAATADAAAS